MKKPLRILLIRHGESEGNVNPQAYLKKGDQHIELTPKGIMQAAQMGHFLARHLQAVDEKKWPLFYVSGYKRPQQTLGHALKSFNYGTENVLFKGKPQIYTDSRLAEHFFGAINFLNHAPLSKAETAIANFLLKASEAVFKNDRLTAKALYGESYLDKITHVKGFIDGSLQRDINEGHDTIVLVAHGRVITAFLAAWFHVPFNQIKEKINNPDNCDVIEVAGEPQNWKATKIYDGPSGKAVDQKLLQDIEPISKSVLDIASPSYNK